MGKIASDPGTGKLASIDNETIKKMITRARKKGVITYDELSEALPQDKMNSEQIEDIMSMLSEMGVDLVENEESADANVRTECLDEPREQEIVAQRIEEILSQERPEPVDTVFDLVEKNPPEYDVYWGVQYGELLTAEKLTVSFTDLKTLDPCNHLDWVKQTYFDKADVNDQLSARDAEEAGCDFDNVFWATGMLSAYSPVAARRLTDFAVDCLQLLADRIQRDRPERKTLLDTVRASRDFAAGKCSVHALLRETAKAQQAWMRIVLPTDAGIRFPWTKFFTNDQRWRPATFLPPMWEEWAKGVAWAAATCLALRPNDWDPDGDVWQRRKEHEAWLLSRLVHSFAPEEPPPLRNPFEHDPLIGFEERGEPVVRNLDLDGVAFAVLPDDIRRIESVSATGDMGCQLPYSLRSIGSIGLDRCNNTISVAEGVVEIDAIFAAESYLDLPSSVERVGSVALHTIDDCLSCDGVREFGSVELNYAYFTFPEGVEAIGSLKIQASDTHLPASLKIIGDVFIDDENRGNFGEDEPARTLFWQEGPTEVGRLELGEEIHMDLPRSIQTIASVRLAQGAHLKLSLDTVILGHCEVAHGATLDRMPASHYENAEGIDL